MAWRPVTPRRVSTPARRSRRPARLLLFLIFEEVFDRGPQLIAAAAPSSPEAKRLMTVPGVNVAVAATFLVAVGHAGRFADSVSRYSCPALQIGATP